LRWRWRSACALSASAGGIRSISSSVGAKPISLSASSISDTRLSVWVSAYSPVAMWQPCSSKSSANSSLATFEMNTPVSFICDRRWCVVRCSFAVLLDRSNCVYILLLGTKATNSDGVGSCVVISSLSCVCVCRVYAMCMSEALRG